MQGKAIVNSISLKEGEDGVPRPGPRWSAATAPAVVVMAFDEEGQADTVERKVAICQRAYRLLDRGGRRAARGHHLRPEHPRRRPPGIEEHDDYAIDFIEADAPDQASAARARKISGGVSNLSFSFRGNDAVREAMHAAFLYHAIRAGMDMGIVNAGQLGVYEEIPAELLERVEDVLFDRRPDATERLVEFAETRQGHGRRSASADLAWREAPVEERLAHALVNGIVDYIEADAEEARQKLRPRRSRSSRAR